MHPAAEEGEVDGRADDPRAGEQDPRDPVVARVHEPEQPAADREPEDPRELSEIPEVRLWFIRLDARYPWLPFLLDWKAGELALYTAMLVPHQFSVKEGIQYNLEALEIFLMQG